MSRANGTSTKVNARERRLLFRQRLQLQVLLPKLLLLLVLLRLLRCPKKRLLYPFTICVYGKQETIFAQRLLLEVSSDSCLMLSLCRSSRNGWRVQSGGRETMYSQTRSLITKY